MRPANEYRYLVIALGARQLVEARITPLLAERGLEQAPRLVQPTPFNTLLWRVTVADGARYHEALVGVFDGDTPPMLETYARGTGLEAEALDIPRGRRLDWFAGPFLRYEVRERDGRDTLVATDLRLGFPGFHPFAFTLATREKGDWQPVAVSQQLPSTARGNREALARLGGRILSPAPMLCTSDFVPREWLIRRPAPC